MSWTDERVERLSIMWLEGRSASRIATELGEGVSRNAVIGKVHRLGLSGRAVPPAADIAPPCIREIPPFEPAIEATTTPEPVAVEPVAVESAAPAAVVLMIHEASDRSARIEASPDPIAFDLPVRRAAPEVVIPISDRVTILELSGSMCRWPIGDPTNAEFRFCGCRATGTLPYCPDHARVAFQPVADRRRAERMIRIA